MSPGIDLPQCLLQDAFLSVGISPTAASTVNRNLDTKVQNKFFFKKINVNKVVFLMSKEKIQQWKLKNNTEAASMVSREVTISQTVHWRSSCRIPAFVQRNTLIFC